jgi:hypothetical protein
MSSPRELFEACLKLHQLRTAITNDVRDVIRTTNPYKCTCTNPKNKQSSSQDGWRWYTDISSIHTNDKKIRNHPLKTQKFTPATITSNRQLNKRAPATTPPPTTTIALPRIPQRHVVQFIVVVVVIIVRIPLTARSSTSIPQVAAGS